MRLRKGVPREPNCPECDDRADCKAFRVGKFYKLCQWTGGAKIVPYDIKRAFMGEKP